MNNCEFVGNLTKEPVVRTTNTGRAVASFTVATNEGYTTPQGEQKQITDYINVVVWGYLAQAVGNQLHKGMRVFVQGRQSTRSYNDQNGQKKWITEVVAGVVALPLSNQQPPQQAQRQAPPPPPQQNAPANGGWEQFGQPAPQATDMFGSEVPF